MNGSTEFDEFVRDELAPDLLVVRTLGRGSVAIVYLAREVALARRVAVKVLLPKHARDETSRRRFEREARSAARVTHPNVTAVHRVGRLSNGVPFLVMEYVDGRNLEDHLAATGRLTVDDAKEILRQLAAGLAAAHEQQIVHRDVKPANVLRESSTGRVLLTDFGLAAAKDRVDETTRLTMHGQVLGDLPFVSPEHLSGEELTELADIYALGIIGYRLVAGRGPYDATSPAHLTSAHLRAPPIPLRQLRPDADPALERLLARCLAKRPAQRPSAREIALELGGEPAELPADTALGRFLRELKRRHVYKVGAAYVAIAIALIGVTEGVQDPLGLTDGAYRAIIGVVLAGFPVTLALSWTYDLRAGRIERTSEAGGSRGVKGRLLPALALLLSLAVAVLIWRWVILRGSG